MRKYKDLFNKITDAENLFSAWEEFRRDKGTRPDVLEFERDLEPNIFRLCRELKSGTYKHGPYAGFFITDPKRRHVHKASVRDRILHHSVFSVLYPIFEPTFISTSFSCQIGKGSHHGVEMLSRMLRKESRNASRPCYALKCDIQKFFDNIDHDILLSFLIRRIADKKVMILLKELVESYGKKTEFKERERESSSASRRRGIPIGNLTSQLFANVYMSEFDNFVKHVLKVKYYARYTDDFVVVSHNRKYLCDLIPIFQEFLGEHLMLRVHPHKISIRRYSTGIDFLGYVILPHCRLIRKRTWKRMQRKFNAKIKDFRQDKISNDGIERSLSSYLGILSHANSYDFTVKLKNQRLF